MEGVIALVARCASAVPFTLGLRGAAAFGRFVARVHGPRTGVARRNLEIAFPELGARARRRLLLDAYANLGRLAFEAIRLDGMTPEEVTRRVRVEGREHLDAALAASPTGGGIVLTAHFGSIELCAAAMAHAGLPLSIVHRSVANARIDARVTGWRERAGIEVLRRGAAARRALRALKSGRLLVVPLDQNAHRREGVFAPFFGLAASTRDAPARLAMRLGVPVLPVFIFREPPAGGTHVIRVAPPLALAPQAGDRAANEAAVVENVSRMNGVLEAAIRRAPDHWIWVHKRWRTRREGEAHLYRRSWRR